MMRRTTSLLCSAGLLALSACAVGPDFKKPTAPDTHYLADGADKSTASASGAEGAAQNFHPEQDIPAEWWTLFHYPELDALLRHAIAHNPSLTAARDALTASEQTRLGTQAALYPSISASFNPTRNKTSRAYSNVPAANEWLYNIHTAQLSIGYSPDLWGGVRRQVESAAADRDAERYQMEAAWLTLTSSAVEAAISYAQVRAQIETTHALIASQQKVLDSSIRQRALGQMSENDVAIQQTALAQANATLPALEQQLAQLHDQIAAIAGDMPDVPTADFQLDRFTLPTELPVSLPVKLITQRPDIKTAEAVWHSAAAQVGVAVANRLPAANLSLTPGFAAANMSQLGVPGYGQWVLAAMLVQPLFDAGKLLHQEKAARAQYDEAAEQYRATIIAAVQDVADSLHALHTDADNLAATQDADTNAARSASIARARLALGDVSAVTLQTTEQAEFQTKLALLQARAARLSDTVGLFQSLGGGWWNRTDDKPRANDRGKFTDMLQP